MVLNSLDGVGDVGFVGRGTDTERLGSSAGLVEPAVGSISPSAVAILLVNEEMAQPAHDLSLDVPIRAASLGASELVVAGRTVSAMVLPNFLTRCRYMSNVLLAWSLMSL